MLATFRSSLVAFVWTAGCSALLSGCGHLPRGHREFTLFEDIGPWISKHFEDNFRDLGRTLEIYGADIERDAGWTAGAVTNAGPWFAERSGRSLEGLRFTGEALAASFEEDVASSGEIILGGPAFVARHTEENLSSLEKFIADRIQYNRELLADFPEELRKFLVNAFWP